MPPTGGFSISWVDNMAEGLSVQIFPHEVWCMHGKEGRSGMRWVAIESVGDDSLSSHAMGLAEDCKTSELEVVPCKPLPAKVVPSALLSSDCPWICWCKYGGFSLRWWFDVVSVLTPVLRRHHCSDDTSVETTPVLRRNQCWDTPVLRLHQCWDNTSVETTPVLRRHQCWDNTSVEITPVLRWHRCWDDTSVETTPVLRLHQCWDDTSVETTPVLRRH